MATPPKRALSEVDDKDDQPDAKRLRSTEPVEDDQSLTATAVPDVAEEQERLGFASIESLTPTPHFLARAGVQRSIAMVLKHDGFETATPEAMESFTTLVETCLSSSAFPFLSFVSKFTVCRLGDPPSRNHENSSRGAPRASNPYRL
jgi:hypothetical protein